MDRRDDEVSIEPAWIAKLGSLSASDRALPSGSYNRNIILTATGIEAIGQPGAEICRATPLRASASGPGIELVARTPLQGVRDLDCRVLPEYEVISSLARDEALARHLPTPVDLIGDTAFYRYVPGSIVDEVTPKKSPLPAVILQELPRLLGRLARADIRPEWRTIQSSYRMRYGLTPGGTTYELNVAALLSLVRAVHRDNPTLATTLRLPSASEVARAVDSQTTPREPVLVHGDIHRKNLRIFNNHWFLFDWEMAQVGDAVYDLAVALWKMELPKEQREQFISLWCHHLPAGAIARWEEDLPAYLLVEKIKTCFAHVYRVGDELAHTPASQEDKRRELARRWLANRRALEPEFGDLDLSADAACEVLSSVR